jgi:hypothetical protein
MNCNGYWITENKMAGIPELQNRKQDDAYRSLMAAVVECTIDDLKGTGLRCPKKETDWAMTFILSNACEAYCLELKIDYERIKEKAVRLYRRYLAKNDQKTTKGKRPGRPATRLKGVMIRQSPGQLPGLIPHKTTNKKNYYE